MRFPSAVRGIARAPVILPIGFPFDPDRKPSGKAQRFASGSFSFRTRNASGSGIDQSRFERRLGRRWEPPTSTRAWPNGVCRGDRRREMSKQVANASKRGTARFRRIVVDCRIRFYATDASRRAPERKKRLAIFVSGGGSNLRALHRSCEDGQIRGEVVMIVSNKPGCGGWEYAKQNGIPTVCYPSKADDPDGIDGLQLSVLLKERMNVDYVLLAGYLKKVPLELVHAYQGSMLNIHPALLPSFGGPGFYGMKVHNAVVNAGCRVSGPTVHFVEEEYDTGKIVGQRTVRVCPTDSAADVAAKVLKEEHLLYSHVVAALCDDRIVWNDDGIPMIRKLHGESQCWE